MPSKSSLSTLPVIACEKHPYQYVTNFCCNTLMPLCPECIDEHTKYCFTQTQTAPEIDTLRRVQDMCIMKTSQQITLVEEELKSLGFSSFNNKDEFVASKAKEFEAARHKLHRIIDDYMDGLMSGFKNKMGQDFGNMKEIMALADKLRTRLEHLKILNKQLQTKQVVTAIRKTCQVTASDVLLEMQDEIKGMTTNNKVFSVNINIQDSEILEIRDTLQKVIFFDNKHEYEKFKVVKKNDMFETGVVKAQSKKIGRYFQEKFHINEFANMDMRKNHPVIVNPFQIQDVEDTLLGSVKSKCLHYFEPHQNFLYLYDIESQDRAPKRITQNLSVLKNSRSATNDRGHIYLTGGLEEGLRSSVNTGVRGVASVSNQTFAFSTQTGYFKQLAPMNVPRYSHGLNSVQNSIYAVSGKTTNNEFTSTCEVYDGIEGHWVPIANCHYPCSRPLLINYRDQMIFKIGGLYENGAACKDTEVYYITTDQWKPINLELFGNLEKAAEDGFNYWPNMGGCQINHKSMLIFGGHDEFGRAQKQSFQLEVDELADANSTNRYKVTNVCQKVLPYDAACQVSQCLINNGSLFVLMDTRKEYMVCGDQWSFTNMIPLEFNGNCWLRHT